jgi:hypothetical protein
MLSFKKREACLELAHAFIQEALHKKCRGAVLDRNREACLELAHAFIQEEVHKKMSNSNLT